MKILLFLLLARPAAAFEIPFYMQGVSYQQDIGGINQDFRAIVDQINNLENAVACPSGQAPSGVTTANGVVQSGSCTTLQSLSNVATLIDTQTLSGANTFTNMGNVYTGGMNPASTGTFSAVSSFAFGIPSFSSATYKLYVHYVPTALHQASLALPADTGAHYDYFNLVESNGGTVGPQAGSGASSMLLGDTGGTGNAAVAGKQVELEITFFADPHSLRGHLMGASYDANTRPDLISTTFGWTNGNQTVTPSSATFTASAGTISGSYQLMQVK